MWSLHSNYSILNIPIALKSSHFLVSNSQTSECSYCRDWTVCTCAFLPHFSTYGALSMETINTFRCWGPTRSRDQQLLGFWEWITFRAHSPTTCMYISATSTVVGIFHLPFQCLLITYSEASDSFRWDIRVSARTNRSSILSRLEIWWFHWKATWTKKSIFLFLLVVAAPEVPRLSWIAPNMVVQSSARTPLWGCGKKFPGKCRYIRSYPRSKFLSWLYSWENFI